MNKNILKIIVGFVVISYFVSRIVFDLEKFINIGNQSLRRVRISQEADFEQLKVYIGEENARKIITDLERLGFSQDEIQKAIRKIVEFIELDTVPPGWWPELIKEFSAAFLAFPRIIALDSRKEPHLLIKPDFRERREIFNNKSLLGLVGYFERTSEGNLKKIFSELTSAHFEVGRMYVLRRVTKTLPETPLEWRERQKLLGSNFNWKELLLEPPEIEAKLVEIIAREKIFPQLSKEDPTLEYYPLDIFIPFYLLKTRWAWRFLNASFENHGGEGIPYKRYIQAYPSEGNIHYGDYYKYLWIDYVRNSFISWEEREAPEEIMEHLVLRVSQETGKALGELLREDFSKLDFLRHMIWDGREIEYKDKGLFRMIENRIYSGMPNFRENVIYPLMEKIGGEIESIKGEIAGKGRVTDWNKYSLWAIKTYIEEEILKPKNKTWEDLEESELPDGLLNITPVPRPPFLGNLNFLKAILWIDLDLYERILIHPITTEDLVTKLLWTNSIEWEKTSKGVRKDWVRMLTSQLGISIDELLSHPKDSDIYKTRINFKSDPLGIFSETFHLISLFSPNIPDERKTNDWSLRALLDEVYNGDPNKLREDLFEED